MADQIVVFQTIAGETGVGKLDEKTGVIKKVVRPLQTAQEVDGQKIVRITLVPFLVPFSTKFPEISLDKVISYAEAIKDLVNQYIETTSGIKLATPEDIQKMGVN